MEFPVSWDLGQLGAGSNLTKQIRAAEILELERCRACVVGDLASAVYGSDVAISDVYIAVADEEMQTALKTLLEHGYSREPQTKPRFISTTPTKDCSSGWPGHRLRPPSPRVDASPRVNAAGVLLIPSSFWHLCLGRASFWSDTLLFPGSLCRFPRLEQYLNALIHTIVERVPIDNTLNSNITRYFRSQYSTILYLTPADRRSQMPIENQFFTQYFDKMLLPKSKVRFFSLWQRVRDGSLNVRDAVASLPRRDMYLAELKAQRAKMAGEVTDTQKY